MGIRAFLQRRNAATRVSRIALVDVLQKGVKVSMYSFVHQLFMTAARALFRSRRQKHLQGRVREHDRPHIAAVRHQPRRAAKRPLAVEQRLAREPRAPRRPWRQRPTPLRLGSPGDVLSVQQTPLRPRKLAVQGRRRARSERSVMRQVDAALERRQRDQPIQRAAVEEMKAQRPATRRATVPLPDADGPSMAMTGDCAAAA